MPNELWEAVRPHDLKVGDVILSADRSRPIVWRDVDAECVAGHPDQYRMMRLRRYSGPSPEVLMRALEMMMAYIDEERLQNVPIIMWLEEAEAKLAAETKGGAK